MQVIKVWDIFVRFFHWTLVGAVLICFLTEDDLVILHIVAGYYIGGLLVARIAWGFIGTQHARFSDFAFGPWTIVAYLRDLVGGRARRYVGHSPAGAAMVYALLLTLAAVTWTGHVSYRQEGSQLGSLPAITTPAHADDDDRRDEGEGGEVVSELHEGLANILLVLIALHIAGVFWSGFAHRENLVRAMISGEKRAQD